MPGYPSFYPQGYGYNPYMQQQPAPQQQNFIHVQSETQAREWNVPLGSSVTFINDNEPFCYTKSMGMSQLEPPVFKKFKLVEVCENTAQFAPSSPGGVDIPEYVQRGEIEAIRAELDDIRAELEKMKGDGA